MDEPIAVQFSDSTEEAIITFLGITPNLPSQTEWPNSAVITTADARYKTYYDAQWPMIQIGLPVPGN